MSTDGKWVIGLLSGCLVIVILGVALIGGAAYMGVWSVSKAINRSDFYAGALERARSDPAVVRALGTPIEGSTLDGGHWHGEGGEASDAFTSFTITGPKGQGTLFVDGVQRGGPWEYGQLEVVLSGSGEKINLVADGAAKAPILLP
jgi:hypothetical protein